jgi:biotin carboxylase
MNPSSCRVLVLGDSVSARWIGRQLSFLGMKVSFAADFGGFRSGCLGDDAALRALLFAYVKAYKSGAERLFIHPGVSRWAGRPYLAALIGWFDIELMACSPKILSIFSHYISVLLAAQEAQVPHLMKSIVPLSSAREVRDYCASQESPFPFILKSSQGNSNTTIYKVVEPKDLEQQLDIWLERLQTQQGSAIVFPERYLVEPRCICVPFVRFATGEIEQFMIVDTTLQSKFRKLIQVCPASFLTPECEEQVRSHVSRFAASVQFVGLGVLEFLLDEQDFYLIGGVARLNTQFELWEAMSQTHAVHWQLAALGFIPKPAPFVRSHSKAGVSVRICSEDAIYLMPQLGVVRAVGGLEHFSCQSIDFKNPDAQVQFLPGVRAADRLEDTDSGILGHLLVTADSMKECFALASQRVLDLRFSGSIVTNQYFLSQVLKHAWVQESFIGCGFLDDDFLMNPLDERLFVLAARLVDLFLDRPSCRKPSWLVVGNVGVQYVVGYQKKVTPERCLAQSVDICLESSRLDAIQGRVKDPCEKDTWIDFSVYQGINLDSLFVHLGAINFVVRLGQEKPGAFVALRALTGGRINGPYFLESAMVRPMDILCEVQIFGMFVTHRFGLSAQLQKVEITSQSLVESGETLALLQKVPEKTEEPERPSNAQDTQNVRPFKALSI